MPLRDILTLTVTKRTEDFLDALGLLMFMIYLEQVSSSHLEHKLYTF